MNKNVSRKFTSLKCEAKNTYLGMLARRIFGGPARHVFGGPDRHVFGGPDPIYYLHKFIQNQRYILKSKIRSILK